MLGSSGDELISPTTISDFVRGGRGAEGVDQLLGLRGLYDGREFGAIGLLDLEVGVDEAVIGAIDGDVHPHEAAFDGKNRSVGQCRGPDDLVVAAVRRVLQADSEGLECRVVDDLGSFRPFFCLFNFSLLPLPIR